MDGVYSDWFDGSRFRDDQEWYEDDTYDFNLGLLINVDWWQPFKRTIHSMGGLYASILNLSRDKRQKLDHILTLGN